MCICVYPPAEVQYGMLRHSASFISHGLEPGYMAFSERVKEDGVTDASENVVQSFNIN